MCKHFKETEIISLLRAIEVKVSAGEAVPHACRSFGVSDKSYYRWRKLYGSMGSSEVRKCKELARQYGRYGYRKITALVRIEGWRVNYKKVERLWREEGLQVPRRHKQRKRLYDPVHSVIRMRPLYPHHIWSVDFVQDRLLHGRPYKILTVIDAYTRQCLTVKAQFQIRSQEVLETLGDLFIHHDKPDYVRSDNGSEFKAQGIQQ